MYTTEQIKKGIEKVEEVFSNGHRTVVTEMLLTFDGIIFEVMTENATPIRVKYSPALHSLYTVGNWKKGK